MIDSAAVQNIVSTVTNTGTSFIPEKWQFLAPMISSLLTLITAAIIRYYEKNKLQQVHQAEQQQLLSKAINAETELIKLKTVKNG